MKYLLYILLFLLFSCENEKKKPIKEPVIIYGNTDDQGFIEHLNIINYSYFNSTNHKSKSKLVKKNSLHLELANINKPQLLELMAFGKDVFHNTKIFVTPGDSIKFIVQKGKLIFKGNNAVHYNFYLELDRTNSQWSKISFKNYTGNIEKYKEECKILYKYRKNFLQSYILKHRNISKEFVKKVAADLKHEYLFNLIAPRTHQGYHYSNVNSSDNLSKMIVDSNRKEGDFFDLSNYLGNPKIEDFNKPELLDNDSFKQSLIPFIRQYFVKNDELPYTMEAFNIELKFIQKNFDIEIVKYATGKLIIDYSEKGLGKDNSSNYFLKNKISNYKKLKLKPTYLEAVSEIETELSINRFFPDELKEKVITINNDTLTLSTVLKLKKTKIKVICFWASWCEPCIRDIIDSKEIKINLMEKYDIEFVYLSLDVNKKKWVEKSVYLKKYLKETSQYNLLTYKNSRFLKFLQMKPKKGIMIPRYVILGRNNKIINNNAPKISNKEVFEKSILEIE